MTANPTTAARPAPMFVGDHLATDFLNSIATPVDVPVEWLADGLDLVDWLEQARALPPEVAARFRADEAQRPALDAVAAEARALRGWLRGFIDRHDGRALGPEAAAELAPLNKLLAEDESFLAVASHDGGLHVHRMRRWTGPRQLLQPIAEAIADLVSHTDFRLIRHCEGPTCTLTFVDRTKAHGRRWCSMAMCGNRAKVAAHRARAAAKRRA